MSVQFHSLLPSFSLKQKRKTCEWLWTAAYIEKKEIDRIDYIFCSDKYLLNINRQFLNHDTFTDIITFDNSTRQAIAGEIYISIERVKQNARQYAPSFDDELRRVMVHGLLHLCGYKDKKKSNQLQMREKEDYYLGLWKEIK